MLLIAPIITRYTSVTGDDNNSEEVIILAKKKGFENPGQREETEKPTRLRFTQVSQEVTKEVDDPLSLDENLTSEIEPPAFYGPSLNEPKP